MYIHAATQKLLQHPCSPHHSILGAVQMVPLSHTEFLVWFFDGPSMFLLVLTYRTDTCVCVQTFREFNHKILLRELLHT